MDRGGGRLHVDRVIPVEPARVFAVLADGWSYPLWVVGATHMRAVDDRWPTVGTQLHHSVGCWPLQLEDRTEVVEVRADELLELRAHAWPSGAARIRIALRSADGGTHVTMEEYAEQGPATLLPAVLQQALLVPRNRECLARLAAVAVGRGPR